MGAKPRGCGGKAAALCPSVVTGSSPQFLPLFVCALCCSPCGSQTVSCRVSLESDGAAASLTCDFSFDLKRIQSDILVQRFNDSGVIVQLAVCKRQTDTYQCTAKVNGVITYTANHTAREGSSEESHQLTLGLPLSDLTAAVAGDYYDYICHTGVAYPISCSFPSVGPPDAPVLGLIERTASSIEVRWDYDHYGDIPLLSFELNYTRGSGDWRSVLLNSGNTSYIATELMCGTLYHFVLRAYNVMGFSPDSQVLQVWTNGSVPDMSSGTPWLREINVTAVTLGFIGSKASASCPIRFFTVKYRRRGNVQWERMDENISSDVREMTVKGLTPASQYSMVVTAHSDAGNSSCRLHFVTLPSPQENETEREKDKEKRGEAGTTVRQTTIALASVLTLAAVVISVLTVVLYRRCRQRGRNTNPSPPIMDDTEMESPAGADNLPLSDPQHPMLREGE